MQIAVIQMTDANPVDGRELETAILYFRSAV